MIDEERERNDGEAEERETAKAPAAPPVAEDAAGDAELPYVVTSWGSLPRYQCRLCPYDTLDRAEIERHVDIHRAEEALRIASARLRESAET
ncbi:MAG: hypothetical protein NZ761_03475 [Dehalococcoidia bacterium]|nr:hypothetical protein [Dehalococcoidia bacterium]